MANENRYLQRDPKGSIIDRNSGAFLRQSDERVVFSGRPDGCATYDFDGVTGTIIQVDAGNTMCYLIETVGGGGFPGGTYWGDERCLRPKGDDDGNDCN